MIPPTATTTTAEFFKEGEGRLWLPVLSIAVDGVPVVAYYDEAVRADEGELLTEGWVVNALRVDQVLPAEPGWYALIRASFPPHDLERPPVLAWSLPSGAYVIYPPSPAPHTMPSRIARVVEDRVSSAEGPAEEDEGARLLGYHHPQHAPESAAEGPFVA